jgi:hypothetical protein
MAVYDRWHKSRPGKDESLCREHRMAPGARHGDGERWQVRWRDEDGAQRARNFTRKTGADPEKSADAFDAKVRTSLDDGSYVSPADANITFRAFAEDWRPGGSSASCGSTCTRRSVTGRCGNSASGRA